MLTQNLRARVLALTLITLPILPACGPSTASTPDASPPTAPPADAATLRVGTFNLLRFGHGEGKDLRRIASLIATGGFQVFAAVEVMRPEAPAELLPVLAEVTGHPWAATVSATATGESTYREYAAFFYRTDVAEPSLPAAAFCRTAEATDRSGSACFAKDHNAGTDAPDFQRDPFAAHFRIGGQKFVLIAVHVVFGDSISARRHELDGLRTVMERARASTPGADVVALGDFNLALESRAGPAIGSEFFSGGAPLLGLIDTPTTLGTSSYDHVVYFEGNTHQHVAGSEVVVRDFDAKSDAAKADYKATVSDHLPAGVTFTLSN
jgi:hypothetical protein